jgi:flagellar basal-body rod modification protein FlgD
MTTGSVNPVNSVTGQTSSAGASAASTSSIGSLNMNDFLTLMTAQLQNQDPLDPTDSNEFLSQLAELSTVEGISSLNTGLTALSSSVLSSQAVSAAGLVGQTVLAPATAMSYTAGQTLNGAVQVPTGASNVSVSISDANGNVVDTIGIPASSGGGLQSFSWNGTGSNGSALPSGTYSISAAATVGGATQAPTTYLDATVSSVTLNASGNDVILNTPQLGAVALGSVQQFD